MSDAAIVSLVTGVVTIATLWLKLKYGVEKKTDEVAGKVGLIDEKVDENTNMTAKATVAAAKASKASELSTEERSKVLKILEEHDTRIGALEVEISSIRSSVDGVSRSVDVVTKSVDVVSKNVDSTRHKLSGDLQTMMNKIDGIVQKAKDK